VTKFATNNISRKLNLTLQIKLTAIVFLVLSVYAFFTFSINTNNNILKLKDELVERSQNITELLSQDFVKIITIGSSDIAIDLTTRLRSQNNIEGLTLYDHYHKPVFFYIKEGIQQLQPNSDNWQDHHMFLDQSLVLVTSTIYRDTQYGNVILQVSSKSIDQARIKFYKQGILYAMGLLLATVLFSWLIKLFLLLPISQLVIALNTITKTHDFSTRLPVKRRDEIGDLFHGFNRMQQELDYADEALKAQKFALDAHAVVAVTNIEGTILFANQKFSDISGYSNEELVGNNHRMLKSNTHNKMFFENLFDTISNGEVWHGDICNKAKDGHLYWVNTTIVPFRNKDNIISSYISIRNDITIQKELDIRYKETEERLKLAMSVANDGLWDWDMRYDVVLFDDRYYTMAGYEPNEFPGNFENFQNKVHPDDYPAVQESIEQYISKQIDKYDVEFRFLHKKGHYFWIRARGKLVSFDKDGKPQRFLGTHSDISETKNIEKILRHSQKMDAIGKLTGGIAHEFNNILSIILGNLELLKGQLELDEGGSRKFDAIQKSSQRAAELTKQLLNFSHNNPTDTLSLDINKELQSIENMIHRSITAQVKMNYNLTDDLWGTKIDSGDLHGAILNLVLNAKDAMDGNGTITMSTNNVTLDALFCRQYPDVVPGDYVQISIHDTGLGMSSAQQEHIFEPFFTTKPQGKGTGLGLAMVFGFVQRSKGLIRVESVIDRGTTFFLYFPRSVDEQRSNIDFGITESMTLDGDETILIVEDEEHLLELANIALEEHGYNIITANCADDALEILSKNRTIDLVFSDVVMPGRINGHELAEFIAIEYPTIRVILTSGYTDFENVRDDQPGSPRNILKKPYTLDELARRVRVTLNQSQ